MQRDTNRIESSEEIEHLIVNANVICYGMKKIYIFTEFEMTLANTF